MLFRPRSFILAALLFAAHSCREEDEAPAAKGYLTLNVSAISISSSPTGGRTKTVSTDNFVVKIFRVGEATPALVFDPWTSAPAQIELETGEYFADAQNLDPPAPAAFEQPWYYGRSENFTIDKEELKTITIDCSMANFKVAFAYSENVLSNFTNWHATAGLISEGESLTWVKDDDREGYFIASPISIEVHLEYTKVFTGELITRNFTASITDPKAATLYKISVDAALSNGQIQIDIGVDDSFEVIDIELGDGQTGGDDEETVADVDGNVYPTVQIGDQTWMAQNLSVTTLNDGTPINNIIDATWGSTTSPAFCWFNNNEANYKDPYGAYYNFYAVQTGKLCPAGWHVPSSADWDELENAIGGQAGGGALKETGTDHWLSPNAGATNTTGFNAVGAGVRNTSSVNWFFFNRNAWMWANESALFKHLSFDSNSLGDGGAAATLGLNVRCVKD